MIHGRSHNCDTVSSHSDSSRIDKSDKMCMLLQCMEKSETIDEILEVWRKGIMHKLLPYIYICVMMCTIIS